VQSLAPLHAVQIRANAIRSDRQSDGKVEPIGRFLAAAFLSPTTVFSFSPPLLPATPPGGALAGEISRLRVSSKKKIKHGGTREKWKTIVLVFRKKRETTRVKCSWGLGLLRVTPLCFTLSHVCTSVSY